MKKFLIAMAVMAAGHAVYAQASFGIQVQGIYANTKATYSGDENASSKYRTSWKAGAVVNLPLTEHLGFRPEVNVVSKGGIIQQVISSNVAGQTYNYTIKQTYRLTYAEVPLNIVYNSNGVTDGMRGNFYIGAGPSISYGLGGEVASNTKQAAGSQEFSNAATSKVVFDNKKNENDGKVHYKPLEFGANIIAGYHFSDALFLNILYNAGLNNIRTDNTTKLKNGYFGLGIGMFF